MLHIVERVVSVIDIIDGPPLFNRGKKYWAFHAPIKWHQDCCEDEPNKNYRYLFFTPLEVKGLKSELELAWCHIDNANKYEVPKDYFAHYKKVSTMIARLDGKAGDAYFLDQLARLNGAVIVHRRRSLFIYYDPSSPSREFRRINFVVRMIEEGE